MFQSVQKNIELCLALKEILYLRVLKGHRVYDDRRLENKWFSISHSEMKIINDLSSLSYDNIPSFPEII